MRRRTALLSFALAFAPPAQAQQPASPSSPWAPISPQAIYLTGDTWTEGDTTFRLYGVQSCLRGTFFTNAHRIKRDCGEASAAMLVALIRDLRPQCNIVATTAQQKTHFVFCFATLAQGEHAGSRVDLGTALISSGFAFAALTPDGKPVHQPYFVAQLVAQKTQSGLWQYADTPDPNLAILRALQARPAQPPPERPSYSVQPQ